jgi:hypothetical protein
LILRLSAKAALDRILVDVFPEALILARITHPAVMEASLPNLTRETQFLLGAIGKTSLDELQRSLQCDPSGVISKWK